MQFMHSALFGNFQKKQKFLYSEKYTIFSKKITHPPLTKHKFKICHTQVPNRSNPPKISSLELISRVFPCKFQQIEIISVSGHQIHFILKICQSAPDISMISRFHDFFQSNLWRVFAIWHNCCHIQPKWAIFKKIFVNLSECMDFKNKIELSAQLGKTET